MSSALIEKLILQKETELSQWHAKTSRHEVEPQIDVYNSFVSEYNRARKAYFDAEKRHDDVRERSADWEFERFLREKALYLTECTDAENNLERQAMLVNSLNSEINGAKVQVERLESELQGLYSQLGQYQQNERSEIDDLISGLRDYD